MNRISLLIIITILGAGALFGQTKKAYTEAAEQAYAQKDYYSALVYYQNLLEFDTTNLDIRYKTAESARKFSAYQRAETHYNYVIENQSENEYPDATFHLGYVKQMQGKYSEAIEIYDQYMLENSGDNPLLTSKADMERVACEWALEQIAIPDQSQIITKLSESINTMYSDFGPAIHGDSLFFSSMRFDQTSKSPEKISKILLAENAENGALLEAPLNDTDMNVANMTFNTDHTKIFYTICERLNDSELRCDLYCRMIGEDGTFGEPLKLPDYINSANHTSTHPSVGYDPDTEKEILYFTSNREGGQGGLDVWYSIIDNRDNFTAPINLESINTMGDELTPFYHVSSNTLYFSSDGYRSFGGYDIYQVKWSPDGFGEPRHLNNPLNSSYHDVYYVLDESGDNGYFASNREGANYIDQDLKACCFDLYDIEFIPLDLDLDAITFDFFSKDSLFGATVTLYDEDTGELISSITNDESAEHVFPLDRCRNYLVIGQKLGYEPDTIKLSTCEYKESQEIVKKLYLEPKELELEVLTLRNETSEPLVGCTVTLFDLTDTLLAPVEVTELGTHIFDMPLIRGHKYRVVASKFGFSDAETIFETAAIPGTKLIKELYLGRDYEARLTAYLPLALYFDNDRPDPRTIKRESSKSYTQTFDRYVSREDLYLRNSRNKDAMATFFESDVKVNYDKLLLFMNQLEIALNNGETYELLIRGFTSPLAQTSYNLLLGQRRVSTIMNEMRTYKEGVLIPFIDNGQLILTEISYGETLAPKDISDSSSNKSSSIYSVEASKERRVEIIDVTQK